MTLVDEVDKYMVRARSDLDKDKKNKKARISIRDLIDVGAYEELKKEKLAGVVKTLKSTPIADWDKLTPELVAPIENYADLEFVVEQIPHLERKQFLLLFSQPLLPSIYVRSHDKLTIPILKSLLKSQWTHFINSTLRLAVDDMAELIELANEPITCSSHDVYRNEFLQLLSVENLHHYIDGSDDVTASGNLVALLSSFPEEQQLEIINKIGKEKITSIILGRNDLMNILLLAKFQALLSMLDRPKFVEMLHPIADFPQVVTVVPFRQRLQFLMFLEYQEILQFIPDHVQLKLVLDQLTDSEKKTFLTQLATLSLRYKDTASIQRYKDDPTHYVILLTAIIDLVRPNLRANALPNDFETKLGQSANFLIASLKKLNIAALNDFDLFITKIKCPLSEVYQQIIRPYLIESDMKKHLALIKPA